MQSNNQDVVPQTNTNANKKPTVISRATIKVQSFYRDLKQKVLSKQDAKQPFATIGQAPTVFYGATDSRVASQSTQAGEGYDGLVYPRR